MSKGHKHWPVDHPYYEAAPTCDLPTKKACDLRYRAWQAERKATHETKIAAAKVAEAERREAAYKRHVRGTLDAS